MPKTNNELREQRILDAAANLFVHYGYDKTTVSDIAREAGISKGAVYLHFKGKEELLERLISREMKQFAMTWVDLIAEDPEGGTIGSMYKNMLVALNSNDFIATIFRQDERVLGSYLRQPMNLFKQPQKAHVSRFTFVQMMQEAGAIRQDIDPKVVAYIMNLLAYGLVAMNNVLPQESIPPTEDVIEGIADIMDRALTPETGSNSEAGKAVLNQIVNDAQQRHNDS